MKIFSRIQHRLSQRKNPTIAAIETWRPTTSDEVSEHIDILCAQLEPLLAKHGFGQVDIRFRIVIEEGAMNAWKHGNPNKKEPYIHVAWSIKKEFTLIIEDKGEGFDLSTIEDPTLKINLTKERGRGIFLIKNFTSKVRWENNGTKMIATFDKIVP